MEGLHAAGEQFVMLDVKGEGYGLQSSADGKGPGLDVIVFGEPYGNIKLLREEHAEHVADFVVSSGRSVVLSLLGLDSDMAERRFVARFLRRLFRNKSRQTQRSRLLVVLDEAHIFAPEGAGGGFRGDMSELVSAIQRCVRQGRAYGIGVLLVDQRPADVSKKLISQCELVIAHAIGHNTDRKALENWVEGFSSNAQRDKMLNELASLEAGEAFVWSPAWLRCFERVQIDRRSTFDSASSPDGDESSQPTVRAAVDIPALESQLAQLVEESQASDPGVLQKRVRQLEQELAAAKATPVVDVQAMTELQQSLAAAQQAAADKEASLRNEIAELRTRLGRIRRLVGEEPESDSQVLISPSSSVALGAYSPSAVAPVFRTSQTLNLAVAQTPATIHRPQPAADLSGDSRKEGGQRRMLIAIAMCPGIDRKSLGVRALLVSTSGTFNTYLGNLRSQGLIVEDNGFRPTNKGLQSLGNYKPLPSGAQLREDWLNYIGGPESGARRMLAAIYNNYPNWVTRQQLGELAGVTPSSGTFNTYLGNLKKTGTIVVGSQQGVRAVDCLF